MNPINTERGETMRRVLLAIVRDAADLGMPIPCNTVIAAAVGIHPTQVGRHMARLRREGAIVPKRHGRRVEGHRQYVQEVRT